MKWLILLCLCLPMHCLAQTTKDYKAPGAPIPPFKVIRTNGAAITNNALKKGIPVMLMIFSPECDHCGQVLDTLKTLAGNFKETQLVLVTEARNKGLLKDFIKKTALAQYPAFSKIGWDGGNLIYFIYTYQLLPQVNVYNAEHKLLRTFTGVFSMDSLRRYIR